MINPFFKEGGIVVGTPFDWKYISMERFFDKNCIFFYFWTAIKWHNYTILQIARVVHTNGKCEKVDTLSSNKSSFVCNEHPP